MTDSKEGQLEAFDLNKLAAALIQNNLEKACNVLIRLGHKVSDEAKYHLTDIYKDYLEFGIDRYGKTKTLLYRNDPVPLYDFYIPLDLRHGERTIRAAGIQSLLKVNNRVIVSGTAGTGKSTFLKHLFLDCIRTQTTIPIFVELRQMNSVKLDLIEYILQSIQIQKIRLGREYLERALTSGHFTILLDAYDEVNSDIRESVRKSVLQMCDRFPSMPVIISSRPDDEFLGWTSFTELPAKRLSLQQALALIEKLNYDLDVKNGFQRELGKTLYKEHESFLSNPLLLTLMLLTYQENAEIPRKKHIFYAQVFETLFNRHDATKEAGYKRQTETKLAMDDFQRILAAFAIQTLFDGRLSMTKQQAITYLRKAKEMTATEVDEEKFVSDLLSAVCLLVPDGLYVTYVHKQFQEYYSAFFISNLSDLSAQRRFVKRIAPSFGPNDTLRLLFEMNPPLVEKLFILPAIRQILKHTKFKGRMNDESCLLFWELQVSALAFYGDSVHLESRSLASLVQLLLFLQSSYQGEVSIKPVARNTDSNKLLESIIEPLRKLSPEGRIPFARFKEYPNLVKAMKSHHLLGVERLRYLLDLKDFIEHKQKKRSTSLDSMLAPSKSRKYQ